MFLHWQGLSFTQSHKFTFSSVGNSAFSSGVAVSVTMPTVDTGQVGFIFEFAINSSTIIPTTATHSGWTSISNLGELPTSGTGVRISSWYKMLSSSDSGTTISGMASSSSRSIIVLICKSEKPITSITNQNIVSDIINTSTSNLPTQTIPISTVTKPSLAFAFNQYSSATYTGSRAPDYTTFTSYVGNLLVWGIGENEIISADTTIDASIFPGSYAMTTFTSYVV